MQHLVYGIRLTVRCTDRAAWTYLAELVQNTLREQWVSGDFEDIATARYDDRRWNY